MSENDRTGGNDLPDREDVMPKDFETLTPQGGGGGTGAGAIREMPAVEKASEVMAVSRGEIAGDVSGTDGSRVTLPLVTPESGLPDTPPGAGGPGGVPEKPEASSFRRWTRISRKFRGSGRT